MVYLIYRTQLEFHTGSSPAVGENQWIPETKLGHYVCLIFILLCTRGRRRKHEEKKAWSTGQSWKSKKTYSRPIHTHTSWGWQAPLLSSVCEFSLATFLHEQQMKEQDAPVWASHGPLKTSIHSSATHLKQDTHTQAYTHKQRGEISSNHIPQTWDIFISFINKQLILTSMQFQGGEHSSTVSWLIRCRFVLVYVSMCAKRIKTAIC